MVVIRFRLQNIRAVLLPRDDTGWTEGVDRRALLASQLWFLVGDVAKAVADRADDRGRALARRAFAVTEA